MQVVHAHEVEEGGDQRIACRAGNQPTTSVCELVREDHQQRHTGFTATTRRNGRRKPCSRRCDSRSTVTEAR